MGLAVVAAAALAAPAALAQASGDDYSTTQVEYGQDVYGGTEGGASTESSSSQSGGAWNKFISRMNGEAEVPTGDTNANGTASIRTRGSEVCYDLRWSGVDATASHIHKAAAGKAGPIVVNFFAQDTALAGDKKSGCAKADSEVVAAINAKPANYYVNVHSAEFPKGEIRGQLAKLGAGDELPYTGGPISKGLLLLGLCVVAAGSTLLAVGQRRRTVAVRARH
ncbi:MAG TPA: CHRD domain-containing protein [Actinomycetes bacterium]|nr:CHRD domain-containing protein [Actinomycetes bacterium]